MSAPAPPTSSAHDLDQMFDLALRLGNEAGELIRLGREQASNGVMTKTTQADVVTAMDKACEKFIRDVLATHRPGDGVYGEEDAESLSSTGVRWIVDPIDGTVNYLYGLADYSVSIAVEIDGVIEIGVVVKPETGEVFSAVRGRGSHCNGVPLSGSSPSALEVTLLSTGFGYSAQRRRAQGEVVAEILTHVRDIRRHGSAALDLCQAAAGRTDGYYEWGVHLWDVAAGALIAREAGLDVRMPGHEQGLVTAIARSVSDDINALLHELIKPEWLAPA